MFEKRSIENRTQVGEREREKTRTSPICTYCTYAYIEQRKNITTASFVFLFIIMNRFFASKGPTLSSRVDRKKTTPSNGNVLEDEEDVSVILETPKNDARVDDTTKKNRDDHRASDAVMKRDGQEDMLPRLIRTKSEDGTRESTHMKKSTSSSLAVPPSLSPVPSSAKKKRKRTEKQKILSEVRVHGDGKLLLSQSLLTINKDKSKMTCRELFLIGSSSSEPNAGLSFEDMRLTERTSSSPTKKSKTDHRPSFVLEKENRVPVIEQGRPQTSSDKIIDQKSVYDNLKIVVPKSTSPAYSRRDNKYVKRVFPPVASVVRQTNTTTNTKPTTPHAKIIPLKLIQSSAAKGTKVHLCSLVEGTRRTLVVMKRFKKKTRSKNVLWGRHRIGLYEELRKSPSAFCISALSVVDRIFDVEIALPYLNGGDLFNEIDRRADVNAAFPEETMRKIFHDVLRGVKHLHAINFAHMDIALENIALERDGRGTIKRAVLIDYDMCERIDGKTGIAIGAQPKRTGRVQYMPPELLDSSLKPSSIKMNGDLSMKKKDAKGKSCDLRRVDAYGLGAVLFTMIFFTPHTTNERGPSGAIYDVIQREGSHTFVEMWKLRSVPKKEAFDLVDALLRADPCRRIETIEAERSPWIQSRNLTMSTKPLY